MESNPEEAILETHLLIGKTIGYPQSYSARSLTLARVYEGLR
jgi:hypothetical protein